MSVEERTISITGNSISNGDADHTGNGTDLHTGNSTDLYTNHLRTLQTSDQSQSSPPSTHQVHPDPNPKNDSDQSTRPAAVRSTGSALLDGVGPWDCCIHPEGWTYFYKIHHRAHDINDTIQCHQISIGSEPPSTLKTLHQIYVNHYHWYAARDLTKLLNDCEDANKRDELRWEYWNFMRDYPTHQQLPPGAATAACKALHCYVMEGIMEKSDTRAPFTLSESKELLQYLWDSDKLVDPIFDGIIPPDVNALLPSRFCIKRRLVAWIMLNVAQHRRINKGRHKTPDRPSILFVLVSVFCLFAPLGQRHHIHLAKSNSELRGDVDTWPTYIATLVQEWKTFNLAATVLLSASVGFLAVPGIDSATRTVTLLSVIFTLGSIMTSVYLLWRHQDGRKVEYNISLLGSGYHVDALAIILSMPFVCLAWGVLFFLVSVMLYSFGIQPTTAASMFVRRQSWAPVLSSSIVVMMTIFGSFAFFRFFRNPRKHQDSLQSYA